VPFCVSQAPSAFFCADFDDGTIKHAYRDGDDGGVALIPPEVDEGGLGDWDPAGKTHQGSLVFATPPILDSSTKAARLNTPATWSASTSQVVLDFAVRADVPSSGAFGLVTVVFEDPNGGAPARAFYELTATGGSISVEGTSYVREAVSKLPSTLSSAGWTQVRFKVSLGANITSELFFGGVLQGKAAVAPARFSRAAGASFLLGLDSTGPAGAMKVLLDDIVFTPN
ncbi:MAG: hypothetical protein JWP87_6062, partial [Labilithrix sp.]|nr:hypothetical protein [Labilithrix sp.]